MASLAIALISNFTVATGTVLKTFIISYLVKKSVAHKTAFDYVMLHTVFIAILANVLICVTLNISIFAYPFSLFNSLVLSFLTQIAGELLITSSLVTVLLRLAYLKYGYILLSLSDFKIVFWTISGQYFLLFMAQILDYLGPIGIIPIPLRILTHENEFR